MSQRMWMNLWIIFHTTNFERTLSFCGSFARLPHQKKQQLTFNPKHPPPQKKKKTTTLNFQGTFLIEGRTKITSYLSSASDLPMGYFSETPAEATSTWCRWKGFPEIEGSTETTSGCKLCTCQRRFFFFGRFFLGMWFFHINISEQERSCVPAMGEVLDTMFEGNPLQCAGSENQTLVNEIRWQWPAITTFCQLFQDLDEAAPFFAFFLSSNHWCGGESPTNDQQYTPENQHGTQTWRWMEDFPFPFQSADF